jgi:uncharacterized protein
MNDFLTFAVIGFLAQLVDGALGMGFGVISSSVLLAQGIPPALVSASVNAAKLPTGLTSAISHYMHKNLDWEIVRNVALFGAIGGVLGSFLLTSLKGHMLSLLINVYLAGIGLLILYRAILGIAPKLFAPSKTKFIGFAGGLIEGIGGSWGPIVTSSLVGAVKEPRFAIGSSNFCEVIVSAAVFLAFLITFGLGHWGEGMDWTIMISSVAGLVVGGLPAAFFGGWLSKHAPKRPLTIALGFLTIGIAAYRTFFS